MWDMYIFIFASCEPLNIIITFKIISFWHMISEVKKYIFDKVIKTWRLYPSKILNFTHTCIIIQPANSHSKSNIALQNNC